jgi:hypothetical protein
MEFTSMDESEIAAGLLLKAPRLADLEFVVNIQDQLTKFAKLGQILARPASGLCEAGPSHPHLSKFCFLAVEDPGMPSSPRCLGGVQ